MRNFRRKDNIFLIRRQVQGHFFLKPLHFNTAFPIFLWLHEPRIPFRNLLQCLDMERIPFRKVLQCLDVERIPFREVFLRLTE